MYLRELFGHLAREMGKISSDELNRHLVNLPSQAPGSQFVGHLSLELRRLHYVAMERERAFRAEIDRRVKEELPLKEELPPDETPDLYWKRVEYRVRQELSEMGSSVATVMQLFNDGLVQAFPHPDIARATVCEGGVVVVPKKAVGGTISEK